MASSRNLRSRESANPTSEQPRSNSVSNDDSNTVRPQSLEEQIAEEEARHHRLEQEAKLRRLRELNNDLAAAQDEPRARTPVSDYAPPSAPLVAKTLKPDKMRAYKGLSEGEHISWFREVETKIRLGPEYFVTESQKILYCMQSLEGDAAAQWWPFQKDLDLEDYGFSSFKRFLLDLVNDPINRRLLSYEKINEAAQRPHQKISVFKAYLEELESHIAPASEEQRANTFLTKMQPNLKNQILATGNVPRTREEIFALALRLERTLEQTSSRTSGTKSAQKGKPLEDRVATPHSRAEGAKSSGGKRPQGGKRKSSPTKAQEQTNKARAEGACFTCGSKDHWKNECPKKDNPNFTSVGSTSTKNDKAPQSPQKRSKKDE